MSRSTPTPTNPNSGFPPGLGDNVVIGPARFAPEDKLTKLEVLLPDFLPEEPLVSGLTVKALQVLSGAIPDNLGEPGNNWVVDRDVRVHLSL